MTPAQESAILEVKKIMKQNFDSFIISYRITNESLRSSINHDWHGDIVDIVGLATITQQRLIEYTSLPKGSLER